MFLIHGQCISVYMGKDKWAEVIEYLRSSKRDPKKTLKLLKGGTKGTETNYTIARASYSMNVIATITQKMNEPKNKGKSLTHVIRQWVKTKDFKDFYNLMRSHEKLVYDSDEANKLQNLYIKQIKDIWNSKHNKHHKEYFNITKGYFIIGTKSGIGKKKIGNNLFSASKEIIDETVPKLIKRFKTRSK